MRITKPRGRFATLKAMRTWNKLAKDGHKIINYQAFCEECRFANSINGRRHIELKSYEAANGVTTTIEF